MGLVGGTVVSLLICLLVIAPDPLPARTTTISGVESSVLVGPGREICDHDGRLDHHQE